MKSPEQELYDSVYSLCMKLGYDVYDHLPLENEPVNYPFIVVGSMNTVTSGLGVNKTNFNNITKLIVDVWGDSEQRLDVSNIADEIYQNCMRKPIAKDYQFYPVQIETTKQLMQDTSVPNMIFNRAMLTLAFSY